MSFWRRVGRPRELHTAARGPAGEPNAPGQPAHPMAPKPRSLAGDAWRDLRRNPIFWVALALVVHRHR